MIPLLTDKVAVITGGGGALGAGIAHGLAQAGAAIVVADVKVEAAQLVLSLCVGKPGNQTARHAN